MERTTVVRTIPLLILTIALMSGPAAAQPKVPEWARDAVWYQIFPERFRNGDPANDPTAEEMEFPAERGWRVSPWTSDWYRLQPWESAHRPSFYANVFDRRYGGDLQGVIDKLDYLKALGISAIYFNPVFEAYSLHKYDASTYHHIDNNFGGDRDGDRLAIARETDDPATWTWTSADKLFLQLIHEAHARGIRVIIDGVFNHSGTRFWAFQDIVKRQANSRYHDWYDVRAWDDTSTTANEFRYKGWWDNQSLPEFREDANGFIPPVREYFFNITRRWMDPNHDGDPSDGIDGWRLDVANEVSHVFWRDWRSVVKGINPDAYIVGEIWDNASDWLHGDEFDAVMNYRFAYAAVRFFIDGTYGPAALDSALAAARKDYPDAINSVLQNLIDSHDTDRLASMIANPGRRYDNENGPRNNSRYNTRRPGDAVRSMQKLIALFQMTSLGAPMVYYGDEAGMWGADDPDDRKPMVWEDLTYEPEATTADGRAQKADSVRFDREMYSWYRTIIHLRNELEPLRRGDLRAILTDDRSGLYAFERSTALQRVVVIVNRGSGVSVAALPLNGGWVDRLTGESFTGSDRTLTVAVPAVGARVLVPAKR